MIPVVTASASMWSRKGHKTNRTANIANAAIKTALFHIGRRPSRTPEKTKPGRVLRIDCAATTGGWLGSGTGVAGAGFFDAEGVSAEVASIGSVFGLPSVEGPASVV